MKHYNVQFDEFRASRILVERKHFEEVFNNMGITGDQAYLYGDQTGKWGYIEVVAYYTIVEYNMIKINMNHLLLENREWVREDLVSLERKLYEYANDSGWFGPTSAERKEQLNQAMSLAIDAFWKTVADCYPEAESGDFPPENRDDFYYACRYAVETWREINVK